MQYLIFDKINDDKLIKAVFYVSRSSKGQI